MSFNSPREGAILNEHATRLLIQDWATYLRARLTLLAVVDLGDAFEQDTQAAKRQDAEHDLAAIPADTRRLFEHAVTQRREQHRTRFEAEQHAEASGVPRMADPDLLDRTALRDLLTEATEPDDTGHILLPSPADHGEIEWLEFRAADLTARPDEHAYRVATRSNTDREKLTRIAAGVAALVLTGFAIWMLFRPDEATPSALGAATANGTALSTWSVTTLTLVADTNATWPLLSTTDATWPSDGQAYIQANAYLPTQVCVPIDTLSAVREVRIAGDGSTPERTYIISTTDTAPVAPDLRVAACSDPAIRISGMLQRITSAPVAVLGEVQQLGENQIVLRSIVVVGPAEQPELPQGAAQVGIALSGVNLDWTTAAPTLRLGDGTQYSAPEVRSVQNDTTELRFLIPAPSEPLAAEFRLTNPTTRQILRWKVMIGPPADRLSILRTTLKVEGITVSETNTLNVVVTNHGAQPLTLTAADIALDWSGVRSPLPAILGIEVPLEVGETRTLVLALPSDLHGVATLSIGAAQFRITA